MNPESLISTMLNTNGITSIVGTNRALAQLPQSATFPALVYQIVSCIPQPSVDYFATPLNNCRVQFNPVAESMQVVKQIHQALKQRLDFVHHETVDGRLVVSARFELLGPMEKDNESGLYTQPVDYRIWFYE